MAAGQAGSSQFVSYKGTGVYFITIANDCVVIDIMPNKSYTMGRWRNNRTKKPLTVLDTTTPHTFGLKLPGWARGTVLRVAGGKETLVKTQGGRMRFQALPGRYVVRR